MTEATAARAAARARTIPQVVIGEQDRLDRQFVQDGLPDYPDGPTGLAAAASTVSIVKGLGADLIVGLTLADHVPEWLGLYRGRCCSSRATGEWEPARAPAR